MTRKTVSPRCLYTIELMPTRVWRVKRGTRRRVGKTWLEWFFHTRSRYNEKPIATSETYRRVNEAARQALTMAESMGAQVVVLVPTKTAILPTLRTRLELSGWRALRNAVNHPTVRKARRNRRHNGKA